MWTVRLLAAHAISVGVAFSPASPISWQDASNARFGRWFDPLAEFGPYPGSGGGDRARVLYLPPLDGNAMAPFAQWPGRADGGFAVRALALERDALLVRPHGAAAARRLLAHAAACRRARRLPPAPTVSLARERSWAVRRRV